MKLTVIGSQGAYPAVDNPTSGYLLQHEGFSLMLDFGSGVFYNLYKYLDINSLDAVLISHYHSDHIADIGALQYAVKVQTDLGNRHGCFPIYGPPGNIGFERLSYHDYTKAFEAIPDSGIDIGPFRCRFMENIHPDGGNAVRISCGNANMVYTGDTGWNEALVEFSSGCDLILCECSLFNCFKGRVDGHLTAGETGHLAKQCGAGELLLCHFPHFGVREDLVEEAGEVFNGKIEPALPGDVRVLTEK